MDSLKEGIVNAWKFSGPIVIVLMIVAVPAIAGMVRKTAFKFRMPAVFTLLSYCFYCTGYTSSFYSMGNAGLSRGESLFKENNAKDAVQEGIDAYLAQ